MFWIKNIFFKLIFDVMATEVDRKTELINGRVRVIRVYRFFNNFFFYEVWI